MASSSFNPSSPSLSPTIYILPNRQHKSTEEYIKESTVYVCYEANYIENEKADHIEKEKTRIYLIYSVKLSELHNPPCFDLEHVIFGVPDMGFGMFGSKLVLAGGTVQDKYGRETKYDGVITYDIDTRQMSTSQIPNMRSGKVKPLVFEIDSKLYVLDTNLDLDRRSFEIYYPNQNHWHCLNNPYFALTPNLIHELCNEPSSSPFSWFHFGQSICMSMPMDMITFVHHSKHRHKVFESCFNKPLPFQGMRITYYQKGFEDVVLISLHEGVVQGRRLKFSFDDSYQKPVIIFDTKYYSDGDGDGEMCGFFSEFGNGNFCLTTCDKDDVYFYTFHVSRCRSRFGGLKLKTSNVFLHKFAHIQFAFQFSRQSRTIFKFAGCSTRSQDGGSKEINEARLYSRHIRLWKDEEKDDDILGTKCVHNSESDDTDSDGDYELALKREEAYLTN